MILLLHFINSKFKKSIRLILIYINLKTMATKMNEQALIEENEALKAKIAQFNQQKLNSSNLKG